MGAHSVEALKERLELARLAGDAPTIAYLEKALKGAESARDYKRRGY